MHWQVWVSVLAYAAINLAFLFAIGTAMGSDDSSGGRQAAGCLFHMFGGTILNGILMGFLVTFLLPIMLGGSSFLPFDAAMSLALPVVKVGVMAVIAVTVLCFVPLVGSFIAQSPGIQAFMEGAIIFRVLSGYTINEVLSQANVTGDIYPGLLSSIGYIIISTILIYGILFGLSFLSTILKNDYIEEIMPVVIGPALGVLGGIIPLFMYSSYVRLSVQSLL